MQKFIVLICFTSFSFSSLANKPKKDASHHSHAHENLAAHVHGTAELAIALEEDNTIEFKLDLPGDSAVGFEHQPKSAAEKSKFKALEGLFRDSFAELVVIPKVAMCQFEKSRLRVYSNKSGHSEWEIEASAKCAQPMAGQKIEIKFGQHMPHLKELRVAIIGADFQKEILLPKGTGAVVLSK